MRNYPADVAGHSNLSVSYFYNRQFDEALQEGRYILSLYPNNPIYQRAAWRGRVAYAYRFSSDDVATEELPFDSARLLTASLSWQVGKTVSVGLWGRNLLDDEYRISSDDLGTEGEQRAFGIDLRWRPRD